MGYCTVEDMRRILPETITIGDQNLGTPSPGRVGSKRSTISVSQAEYYINYAQQYIDSRLRSFYSCPLRRVKTFEVELYADAVSGNNVSVAVRDSAPFYTGCLVRVQDKDVMETATVASVTDLTTIVINTLSNAYSAIDSKIAIIEHPDPVNVMAARFSCAFLIDRVFVSEQSPDVSNFGKTSRNMARDDMNDILSGEILLFGQEHTGRRFVRGSLLDAFSTAADTSQMAKRGQERE